MAQYHDFAGFEATDLIPGGRSEIPVPQGNEIHLILRIIGIVCVVCVLAVVVAA